MTSDLPAPLTTEEHDISGLQGFLLNTDLLMASELMALSTGDEFKAAVSLWCRAWKQSPPGSLPDDDRVLAAFSGAGREWRKVKAMALRGFVKCSDGRLYHRTLCDDVLRAAAAKAERTARTKAATEARKRKRDDNRDDERHEQRDDDRHVTENTNVTMSQGKERKGKERKKIDNPEAAALGTRVQIAAAAREDIRKKLIGICGDAFRDGATGLDDLTPITDLIARGADIDRHLAPAAQHFANRKGELETWKPVAMEAEKLMKQTQPERPFDIRELDQEAWDRTVGAYARHLARNPNPPQWTWNAQLGPRPGERGCKAPADVLQRHGFTTERASA